MVGLVVIPLTASFCGKCNFSVVSTEVYVVIQIDDREGPLAPGVTTSG